MTGPRPMMRMIRFVVLTWMAVGLVPRLSQAQAVVAQAVVIGEGNVPQQIGYEECREELWTGQHNCEMVRVSHIEARNPLLLELKRA